MTFNNFYQEKYKNSSILLVGEDTYLASLAVKKLKGEVSLDDLDYVELNSPSEEQIIQELATIPFLSEKRVVLVRDYKPKKADCKKLQEYLDSGENYNLLIIVNTEENTALASFIPVVSCEKNNSFASWYISKKLKQEKLLCGDYVIDMIIDFCSCNLARIDAELIKLIGYCQQHGEITQEDVEKIVSKDLDYKIYQLTECVALKQNNRAYSILTDLLNKNQPQQMLFISLYNHFRRLLYCRVNGKNIPQLVEVLGIKEYAVKKAVSLANKFSATSLKDIVNRFLEYDLAFKSGKIDISRALWLSVFGIMLKN